MLVLWWVPPPDEGRRQCGWRGSCRTRTRRHRLRLIGGWGRVGGGGGKEGRRGLTVDESESSSE